MLFRTSFALLSSLRLWQTPRCICSPRTRSPARGPPASPPSSSQVPDLCFRHALDRARGRREKIAPTRMSSHFIEHRHDNADYALAAAGGCANSASISVREIRLQRARCEQQLRVELIQLQLLFFAADAVENAHCLVVIPIAVHFLERPKHAVELEQVCRTEHDPDLLLDELLQVTDILCD